MPFDAILDLVGVNKAVFRALNTFCKAEAEGTV